MGKKGLSCFRLIRGNHEPFNRLVLDESIETRSLPTLARCYPRQLYLDHSHCPVLAPATLAALPSTRAIETRSLPSSLAATHRGFAFYVAFPKSSIPSIATCSMSLITSAPFADMFLRRRHFNGRQSCIVSRL